MDQLITIVLTTIASISVIILVATGLALVFGLMGVINMAHGEFVMVGAFVTLTVVKAGVNFWLAIPIAAIAVGLLGLVVERLLIRFLYGRLIETMLATWGLSLIMIQVVVLIFGQVTQGIPTPLSSFMIGTYSISQYSMALIGAALILMGALYAFYRWSHYGLFSRATAQMPEMAASLGINYRRTNMVTFSIGCALAGLAGALIAPLVGVLPFMGQTLIAKAFVVVVLGGPAFLTGTALSAVLLGSIDSFVSNQLTTALGAVALLLAAMVFIRFFPTGLSGAFRGGRSL